MKRILLAVMITALISLTACTKPAPELSHEYEADITVRGGDFDCDAHVVRSPDYVILTLSSPDNVKGVRYAYDGAELTATLGELSCINSADSLPASSLPRLICEALLGLDGASVTSSDGEAYSYELTAPVGNMTVVCENGLPVSISSGSCPYSVTLDPVSSP